MNETERLLGQSAPTRARHDTWPTGWIKKWIHRVLTAAIALAAAYLLGGPEQRAQFFLRVETAVLGVIAVLIADVFLYPWNLLLAPLRQRNELREFIRSHVSTNAQFAELSTTLVPRGHNRWRVVVFNSGTLAIQDIVADLPNSNWVIADGWTNKSTIIKALAPGQSLSIPIAVRHNYRSPSDPVAMVIAGTCQADASQTVETSALLDPHELL